MREAINRHGPVSMQEHALDDIAEAFQAQGVRGEPPPHAPGWLYSRDPPDRFFGSLADRMLYEYHQAYIFRFVAPD